MVKECKRGLNHCGFRGYIASLGKRYPSLMNYPQTLSTEQSKDAARTSSFSSTLPKILVCITILTVGILHWYFNHNPANAQPMLKIGKGTSYEKEWTRVDSAADKGLYQSAL